MELKEPDSYGAEIKEFCDLILSSGSMAANPEYSRNYVRPRLSLNLLRLVGKSLVVG